MRVLSVTLNTQGDHAIVRLNARPIMVGTVKDVHAVYDRLVQARNVGAPVPQDLLALYEQADPSNVNPPFDSPSTQHPGL